MRLQAVIFDIDGTLVDLNILHGKGGDLLVPDLLRAKEMRKFGEDVKKYDRIDAYFEE